MIQVIATNLTQTTTKDKCEEENIKLGFTEYLPFSRNQTLNQLSGDLPLVQLTFTIEEDGLFENETENKYVIDNSYMLLANNVKEVVGNFLANYKHYNYDFKSTMAPINYEGFNQETDAKILSIRFYPRKFRQDQLLCRCFVILPQPLTAEDMTIIEQSLHKTINNFETEIKSSIQENQKNKNEEKLPEELSSVKIDAESSNSYEESVPMVTTSENMYSANIAKSNYNSSSQEGIEDENLDNTINSNKSNIEAIDDEDDINIDALITNQLEEAEQTISPIINNDYRAKEISEIDNSLKSNSDFGDFASQKTNKITDIETKNNNSEEKAFRLNSKISQYLEFMSIIDDDDEDEEDVAIQENINVDNHILQHFFKSMDVIDEDPQNSFENIKERKNVGNNPEEVLNEIINDCSVVQPESEKNIKSEHEQEEIADVVESPKIMDVKEEVDFKEGSFIKNIDSKDSTSQQPNSFYSTELMEISKNKDSFNTVLKKLEENKELFIEIKDNLAEYKTVSKKEVLNDAFSRVIKFFKSNERSQLILAQKDEVVKKELIGDIERHIDNYITEIPNDDKTLLISMVKRALFSYYILTPLINDNTISDIKVLAPNKINIKKNGVHYTVTNLAFLDDSDYKSFVDNLVERYQVPINSMFLVFSDIDFNPDYRLRFNISLPFVNSTGLPYLHIRKVPKNKLSLPDLINAKMMTPEIALYLIDAIKNKSVLISGPSASGKTNLANALIDVIPYEHSGVVIQESEELFSDKHPNLMFQHMTKTCDLEALGTNGLLCDAGYFIIGEIKGKEARNFSKAAATGHKCMATIHASSSAKSIDRLVDYIRLGDKNYTTEDSLRLIQDMNVLVFVKNFKIQEIDEVVGIHENGQELIYKPIYRYEVQKAELE